MNKKSSLQAKTQMSLTARAAFSAISQITLVVLVILAGLPGEMRSQSPTEQNIQFTQGKVGSGLEFSLAVPIKNLPGRGGTGINISLNYSSKTWRAAHLATVVADRSGPYEYPATIAELIYSEWSTAGWNCSLELPRIEWPKMTDRYWTYGSAMSPIYASGSTAKRVKKVFIHMPDGSTHELRASDTPYTSSTIDVEGTFYAIDGSRMRYDSTNVTTGTLYLQDGTRYVLGGTAADSSLIDRFGNYITRSYTDGKWRDALGREIGVALPSNPTADTTTTVVVPGLSGDITYTLHWARLGDALTLVDERTPDLRPVGLMHLPIPGSAPTDFDGNNYPQSIGSPETALFSDSSDSSDPDAIPPLVVGHAQAEDSVFNPVVLTQIDLPNETTYEFTYNVYGEIDHVKYPTGATESCEYEIMDGDGTMSSPYDQANRGTKQRVYSAKGDGSDNATWTYDSTTGAVSHITTITMNAPDGTRTESDRPMIKPPKLGTHGGFYWGFDYSDPLSGMVTEERTYSSGDVLLSRKLTEYERTSSYIMTVSSVVVNAYRDPRPVRETQIIFNGTGSGNALAKTTTFDYDTSNALTIGVDQTEVVEYGFVSVSHSSASNDAIGSISIGDPLRKTRTTYETDSSYLSRNILGLPTVVSVLDGEDNEIARTETAYDGDDQLGCSCTPDFWTDPGSGVKRGLATNVKQYTNIGTSAYIETSVQYDQFGNVRKNWDGNGNLSEIAYSSTHAYAYPTTTTSAVPVRSATDSTGVHGSSSALVSSMTYDAETGLILTKTDPNSQVSTLSYADDLDRPTSVDSPGGGRIEFVYGDDPDDLFIKTRTKLDATRWQETTKYFDGLARPIKVKQNDSAGDTFVETEYDEMGRVWKTSNSYRAGDTVIWTTNAYDDLGRVLSVTTPDGSAITTEYGLLTSGGLLGTTTLVTDQASKNVRA